MQTVMVNEKVVATIQKNNSEEIRVSVGVINGYKIANVRVWYRDREAMRPSQKGVAFRVEKLGEIIEALEKARVTEISTIPELR